MIRVDGEKEEMEIVGDIETIMTEISYLLYHLRTELDFPEETIMPSILSSYYTVKGDTDDELGVEDLDKVLERFERDSKLFLHFLKGVYKNDGSKCD